MNNKDTVIQHVRFGLAQLSSNNGQLEFEHICRHISRARICSNIIPATGPVQAGGDQGRDFETFHTYLKKSPIHEYAFIALISEKPIAFACSLEKNPTKNNGKIVKDVSTITGSGVQVERVYFFSGEDIPVAKRHKIQEWALSEKSVDLEVLDTKAISEFLAEPDLFWIANKYLSVSAEIYPRPADSSTWYEKLLQEYQKKDIFPLTFEAFQEVKTALRHIYKDEKLKQDLPFWLDKMRLYINEDTISSLSHLAIYEVFVASLIGLNNVDGQEENIRKYFAGISRITEENEFVDVTCLLSFVRNSTKFHKKTEIEIQEIENWKNQLIHLMDSELNKELSPYRFCVLTELKALQYTNGIRIDLKDASQYSHALDQSIAEFNKIISVIPEAPLFPLEQFSDRLTQLVKLFIKVNLIREDLEILAERVDELLGQRVSEFIAAEKLRERAFAYIDSGNEVMGIKILHKAKSKWLKKETLEPAILTLLALANCYEKLKMIYAAKYYAMSAAHYALRQNDPALLPLMIKSVNKFAGYDYVSGAWFNYLDLLGFLFPTILAVKKDFDLYQDDDAKPMIYHATVIKYIITRFTPSLKPLFELKVQDWQWIKVEIEEFLKIAKPHFDNISEDQFWENLEDQIYYRPFSDLGKIRKIEFSSYGIDWKLTFHNNFKTNAVAEQCVSSLQILLVELADDDFHLIKTSVEINVELSESDELKYHREPSNDKNLWIVSLPIANPNDDNYIMKQLRDYHILIFSILYDLSLLPSEEFWELTKKTLDEGNLNSKTLFGRFYNQFFTDFYNQKRFEEPQKHLFSQPFQNRPFRIEGHPLLEWKSSTSAKFELSRRLEDIRNRYSKSKSVLEVTLKNLLLDEGFKKTVHKLREEGWLDWQITMSLANAIMNYKAQKMFSQNDVDSYAKNMVQLMKVPESQSYIPIPPNVYSLKIFQLQMMNMLITTLRAEKLEIHTKTPNFSGVKELLNERFEFNKIDIEDLSPFQF